MRDEEAARERCLPAVLAGPGRVPDGGAPARQQQQQQHGGSTGRRSADTVATEYIAVDAAASTLSPLDALPLRHSTNSSPPEVYTTRPRADALTPSAAAPSPPGYPHISRFELWALRASDSEFNALSGAVGGFMSGIVTCPLDVIKTKLQAQGGFASQAGQPQHRTYNGLVGTARVIWRDEGPRGLYRGLGPIILGYLPTWAVWFTVYNKSKTVLGERCQNAFVISFFSALVAGASSTIATNPIWVIKTRLMSQMPHSSERTPRGANTLMSRPMLHTPWHYRSTLDAARKMYTTEGILSFYAGLTPALLGLTHVAVQFPAYEFLKTKFTGGGMGDSGGGDADTSSHWFGILSATILSKVLASSLTYPHEVIRTRLQTQRRPTGTRLAGTAADGQPVTGTCRRYHGVITTFRTILHEEGWRAFYAGLGTNMMRAVPAATVTMLTYEYVMRQLKHTRHEAHVKLQG